MKALKVVNVLLLIDFVVVVGTAIAHKSIPYDLYQKVHVLPGLFLLVLVCIHLFFNRVWIKKTYFKNIK